MTARSFVVTRVLVVCLAALLVPSHSQAQSPPADQAQALLGLARVKRDAGDAASARRHFEDASRLRPLTAAERIELFWILQGVDAIAAFDAGMAILRDVPLSHDVRDRTIALAIALDRESVVVALAEAGARLQPGAVLWARRLAESYLRQAKPKDAAAALTHAALRPDADHSDRATLAVALEASHQFAESLAAWKLVPEAVRLSRETWQRSYLRALASGPPTGAAGDVLEAWVAAHPDDQEMRSASAAAWTRAGRPERAVAVLEAGGSTLWLRRATDAARSAGLLSRAIALATRVLESPGAKLPDRLTLVALLIESKRHAEAMAALRGLPAEALCETSFLTLLDRVPSARGTQALVAVLTDPECAPDVRWLARGIERSVAESSFDAALKLIARLPSSEASKPARLALAGQLQLWTGHAAAAVPLLESALKVNPRHQPAREALIDALRSLGRTQDAWAAAEPLIRADSLAPDRVITVAALAIEAARPQAALDLFNRTAPTMATTPQGQVLIGRAQLALGKRTDAWRTLSAVEATQFSSDPAAALALIDATRETRGSDEALVTSRRFTLESVAWRDVVARRYVLEALRGDHHIAETLRGRLATIDATAAFVADAEVALGRRTPQDALIPLASVPAAARSQHVRYLEALALAGVGRVAEARAISAALTSERPESWPYRQLDADLGHRLAPSTSTISRLRDLVADAPESADATTLLVRALVATGRAEDAAEAFALLDRIPKSDLSAELFDGLATTFLTAGDRARAVNAARRSIDLNPRLAGAWFVLIDLAAPETAGDLAVMLTHLGDSAPDQPVLLVGVADRLSGFVDTRNDEFVSVVIAWIDDLRARDPQLAVPLGVSRARVLAADERWADALTTLDDVLRRSASDVPALKLRAEVLSWSGEHMRAIDAYTVYLRERPQDENARRQQARVAGWAGRSTVALRLYADLEAMFPNSAVIAAEHAAKAAFFTGRWQAAAEAYARWLTLEPDNGEARFEHAQALRAAGRIGEADAALAALAGTGDHALAPDGWARVQRGRQPHVSFAIDTRSANGYGGQKLLERRTEDGSFGAALGRVGSTTIDLSAGRAALRGIDGTREGFRTRFHASSLLSPTFEVDARADLWSVWSDVRITAEGSALLRFRPVDRWAVEGGFDRSLLFENMTTVDQRLTATGVVSRLRFDSPASGFEASLGWHSLSDGNSRWRTTVMYSRAVSERVRGLRALMWGEVLSFRDTTLVYYSPASQVRLDVGAQYTHDFRLPRFQGDRVHALTGAYLIGTDRDGVVYHHPTVRFTIEFARGVSFDARADWIRSAVYNDRTITFGIALKTGRGSN